MQFNAGQFFRSYVVPLIQLQSSFPGLLEYIIDSSFKKIDRQDVFEQFKLLDTFNDWQHFLNIYHTNKKFIQQLQLFCRAWWGGHFYNKKNSMYDEGYDQRNSSIGKLPPNLQDQLTEVVKPAKRNRRKRH